MLTFNKTALREALTSLSDLGCIAFMASCCERLLPNYQAFSMVENWGKPELMAVALDNIWRNLGGEAFEPDRVENLIEACEQAVPDSDDFSYFLKDAAIDAASSIVCTLQNYVDPDPRRGVLTAEAAINTVHQYLFVVNSPHPMSLRPPWLLELWKTNPNLAERRDAELEEAFDDWTARSPLMQSELDKQQRDLQILQSATGLDKRVLMDLRQSSQQFGIQPFGRRILPGAKMMGDQSVRT